MKPRYKRYLRLNLISILFLVVSFISVTLAWFAYSGLRKVSTEIGIKAWNIEFKKDEQVISNDIVISLDEISPGMATVSEIVKIRNLGDSNANIKYEIESARILDEDEYMVDGEVIFSNQVEDIISHNYPFHININLSKNYALAQGDESDFEVSISWPLDSGDNVLDSFWGNKAYEFQQMEEDRKDLNPEYEIRPSIKIVISVTAEQYLEVDTDSDIRYNLGDTILFDVVNSSICSTISSTCLETYVIDKNNTLGDNTITLLPDLDTISEFGVYANYNSILSTITTGWTVNTRPLLVSDLLKIISADIFDSLLIRNDLSDLVIGNLKYDDRMNIEINRAISGNGYYQFINEKFSYLHTVNCYWTNSEYDSSNAFAVKSIDETNSKIYGEDKTTTCNIVPIIIANKINLE
ncbi:MAG: hypothetical protein WDA21_03365 [Bacilli bacterium]